MQETTCIGECGGVGAEQDTDKHVYRQCKQVHRCSPENTPKTAMAMRDLFGGAIQAPIPGEYRDVAQLRQVPDNQEVFVAEDSDDSVIVELLEWVEDEEQGQQKTPAQLHFEVIGTHNEAQQSELILWEEEVECRVTEAWSGLVCGVQQVAKYTRTASVLVVVGVIRMANVATDMVISHSHPLTTQEAVTLSKDTVTQTPSYQIVRRVMQHLVVRDWSLFT